MWGELLKGLGIAIVSIVGTYYFTKRKEKQSSASERKRNLLEFLITLRVEMEKTYFDGHGPMVRNLEIFHEVKPEFCALAESIRTDFSGMERVRFQNLSNDMISIAHKGFSEDGRERALKAIDDLIEFLRAKI